ncbi:MAG: ribonuclease Y [Ignavibacteria bacterium GWA2_55_11]|nr:MAG: ribonuclease Y [Ignavibacteria bacterium GWA2_55_11]OGU44051.1 MAG: ribonuclease Y [Ignavibacteria bacterium GWC2_56_12]OGU68352.1 MAG: ribonuclease Y [Ignavibacteria bacterium RIFCSPHIGHO2_02_FULL_56_12]
MDPNMMTIVIGAAIGGVSFFLGWFLNARSGHNKLSSAEERAKKILEDAEKEANTLKREKLVEAKDEWFKRKKDMEAELQSRRNKLQAYEKQIQNREENVERKLELLNKKESSVQQSERDIMDRQKRVADKELDLERLIEEEIHKLERISGVSREEAKKYLQENLLEQVKTESAVMMKEVRDNAKIDARREAQKIVVQAIQRTAADHTVETTASVLTLESDEIKGRIIGREGRNIKAFEAATGVDVIVDDTPEAVILTGFDPFRREIARQALERLIADGRIHPARIEEVVDKVRKELEEEIVRIGENTLLEVGLHTAHVEIVKHIGKMKYRSSYGQNLLQHSIEVAYLTGIMASELRLDTMIAKRAGLLHDIGKTIDRSVEGPHALLGMELCKKYNEQAIVCNAVGSHHEDIPMEHPIASLVQAADAISGARPGARRESVEEYIKRLERLEGIAKSFNGVTNTYAIQAGREVRVIVNHEKIDDALAEQLSHDIANKIQQEMEYPGQIKVVVIREVRSVAIAK